jgi:hypothetical protein
MCFPVLSVLLTVTVLEFFHLSLVLIFLVHVGIVHVVVLIRDKFGRRRGVLCWWGPLPYN